MDTMFSDFALTATRLATLLTVPVADYPPLLLSWWENDQRDTERRRSWYKLTYDAIESLHRRDRDVQQVRSLVEGWRLDAAATPSEHLNHNIRATTQYLDQHGERDLVLLPRQKLEGYVERTRVIANPHLFAQSGGIPTRIWLDCTADLPNEEFLIAKCHITLWLGQLMRTVPAQVEVVHSAARRIVARDRIPSNFADHASSACAAVHRWWSGFDRRRPAAH
jgi:hypothetical protein